MKDLAVGSGIVAPVWLNDWNDLNWAEKRDLSCSGSQRAVFLMNNRQHVTPKLPLAKHFQPFVDVDNLERSVTRKSPT